MARVEKTVGTSQGKRLYDLPLNRDEGTGFLILLIALMSLLAVLAIAASFTLSAMTERWTSGLENRITIEIPAEGTDGRILGRDEVTALSDRALQILKSTPSVHTAHMLDESELTALVKPWLGSGLSFSGIPLPSLIAVTLSDAENTDMRALEEKIISAIPQARIDTHETWLNDLLRFTKSLRLVSAILLVVIGITTATAVAGAIRSRMAVHAEEISLLHLMGASDNYISRQFQHNAFVLALRGSATGTAAGILTLLLIGWISGQMGANLLPEFHLGIANMLAIAALPFLAAALAALTSRQTVHRALKDMP
ncbi:MAG: permease [Proteobacteria bacterium]|nr:permease [Pseudomonadota bacterium]